MWHVAARAAGNSRQLADTHTTTICVCVLTHFVFIFNFLSFLVFGASIENPTNTRILKYLTSKCA